MIALDTNVVVRFVVDDDAYQAARARQPIADNPVLLTSTVVLECEWVLPRAYALQPGEIAGAFGMLMGLPQLSVSEPEVLRSALDYYRGGIDFADALHLAGSPAAKAFATFDRKLMKKAKAADVTLAVVEP